MRRRQQPERGAAVVEFALVVPVLLVLALGIVEFGRAYQVQNTLSGAAREGVRVMALTNDQTATRSTTKSLASSLPTPLTDAQIAISPSTCVSTGTSPAAVATVTVTYPLPFLTKLFGSGVTLTGKGAMRCNG